MREARSCLFFPADTQTISAVGVTIGCLLQLLLAGYILYTVNRNAGNDKDQHLNEFFLKELASGKPRFLPFGLRPTAIEHEPPVDDPQSGDRPVITAGK